MLTLGLEHIGTEDILSKLKNTIYTPTGRMKSLQNSIESDVEVDLEDFETAIEVVKALKDNDKNPVLKSDVIASDMNTTLEHGLKITSAYMRLEKRPPELKTDDTERLFKMVTDRFVDLVGNHNYVDKNSNQVDMFVGGENLKVEDRELSRTGYSSGKLTNLAHKYEKLVSRLKKDVIPEVEKVKDAIDKVNEDNVKDRKFLIQIYNVGVKVVEVASRGAKKVRDTVRKIIKLR